MAKLKTPVEVETAFGVYRVIEQIGEGGAGRVFRAEESSGAAVAIKVLATETTDKRRRFKNEVAFLQRTNHPNIIKVLDHGVASAGSIKGPFYVMPCYEGSARSFTKNRLSPERALALFSQILDGVEAAHLQGVVHRDLKPENVLVSGGGGAAVVADFGIAHFVADMLHTMVDTAPNARLANFQYAAPEQRVQGGIVTASADIYALGLMLNELFTGQVPHGTDYQRIETVAADHAFLDPVVAEMLRQTPTHRPNSIAAVKGLIQKHRVEAVSLQKLSALRTAVIPAGEVDDPLAHEAPKLIAADYNNGELRLTLDRPVHMAWVQALHNMGGYSSIVGADPQRFRFHENTASISVGEHAAQAVIDHFKAWLPIATRTLKTTLETQLQRAENQRREELRRAREAEERRIAVNSRLRI